MNLCDTLIIMRNQEISILLTLAERSTYSLLDKSHTLTCD
jgi:hypothetical protein